MLYKQLLITYKKIVSICIIKFSKNKIQFFLREKDLSKPSKTSLSSFNQELFACAKPRSS